MVHNIYIWDMGFTRHKFLYLLHVLALYYKYPTKEKNLDYIFIYQFYEENISPETLFS